MKSPLKLAALAAITLLVSVIEVGSFDRVNVMPEADAIIGRPLTPISFAGVARRTARRCYYGVYYCK